MKFGVKHIVFGGIFLGMSCAAHYNLDQAQVSVRNSFTGGNFTNTISLVENLEKQQVYKPKDRLLLHLEKGTAYHFAGDYKKSFAAFEEAERTIENNYTKSVARGIQSFLVNDNMLVYDGEDYEDVYVNAFKALNFLHMGDVDGALVEARRMSYKIENLNVRHNGISSALAKANTTKGVNFETGKAEIQSSSLSHFLSTILFTKTYRDDNARIEFERLQSTLANQQLFSSKPLGRTDSLEKIKNPDQYNTLFMAFSGRAPEKRQSDTRLYLDEIDTYIKISVPKLQMFPSEVYQVRVRTADGKQTLLPLIEQMDHVAKEIYKIKEPIIYARTYVRVAAKIIAGKVAEKEAKDDDNEVLSGFLNVLTKVGVEATEKADLRGWQSMPGEVYGFVMNLPEGEQSIYVDYLSASGAVLYTEERNVIVTSQNPLHLVETIYWN